MSETDKHISDLGYVLEKGDVYLCYLIYRNDSADKRVEIAWSELAPTDEDYNHAEDMIRVETISKAKDWYGHLMSEPIALNTTEIKAFLTKFEEMKNKTYLL